MGSQMSKRGSGEAMKTSAYDFGFRATTLAYESNSSYACCIAINNTIESSLTNPSFYCSSGNLQDMPSIIQSEYKGFILAKGGPFFQGTCGVMSYDVNLADKRNKKLQIMWYVPCKISFGNCCSVKIRIGTESADKDLFDKMYNSENDLEYGFWCDAKVTPNYIFNLDQMFEAEVLMANKSKTPLIIELRRRNF